MYSNFTEALTDVTATPNYRRLHCELFWSTAQCRAHIQYLLCH